jgi:hypothetical protein
MSFYGSPKPRECRFQKYDKVKVVAGRKVPIGTEGEVFWVSNPLVYGQSRFATTTFKLGVKDAQGNVHWTYDQNVELIEREGKPATHDGLGVVIWPTPQLFDGSER